MKYLFTIIIGFLNYISNGQSIQPDTCLTLQKDAVSKRLGGTENSYPIIVANEIIIRWQELNEKSIDTLFVIKCPDSFLRFQNLAGAGIISVKTSQSFQVTTGIEILDALKTKTGGRKVEFAINGILTEDLSIKISKKSIIKMDILLNAISADKHISPDVAVVNIWTITKKERRSDAKLPKACRGIGSVLLDKS